jgi:hypothetical protein
MNWGGFRISSRTLAALVAAVVLIAPAQAGAATAGKLGGKITIASGSEATDLTVTRDANDIIVEDSVSGVSAGAGCTKAKGKKVKCPVGENGASLILGGGDDVIDTTSAGVPVAVWGGDGNDSLRVSNTFADYLSCGDGSDVGSADATDTLAADCEAGLERPAIAQPAVAPPPLAEPATEPSGAPVVETPDTDSPAPGEDPGDETAASGDTGSAPAAPVAIKAPSTVHITESGALPVGVSCTADAGKCTGTIEIVEEAGAIKARATVGAARGRKVEKATLLGRGKFAVPAGKSKSVTVRLSRRGRQRIIKKKKKKTRAKIVVSMRAPDGTVTTTEKKISIAAPKERRTSARRGGKKSSSKGRRR